MDISNLKARHFILTDFLKENNFCKDVKCNIKSCIRIVFDIGSDPDIKSYEELFYRVIHNRGIEVNSPKYHRLRHGLGTVWAFDKFGRLPNNRSTGFLGSVKTVDKLNSFFRKLADSHLKNGYINGKRERTVLIEHNAAQGK